MFSFFRLILSILLTINFNFKVLYNFISFENYLSCFSGAIILTFFNALFFCYAKNFFYVYRKNNKFSFLVFILENILLAPAVLLMFAIPLGLNFYIDSDFYFTFFILIILLFDINYKISKILWKCRRYEYAELPNSGEVESRKIDKLMMRLIALFVLLPILGCFSNLLFRLSLS